VARQNALNLGRQLASMRGNMHGNGSRAEQLETSSPSHGGGFCLNDAPPDQTYVATAAIDQRTLR
jgi:hypothetical protein